MAETVGFIGLGLMGRPMALHLVNAGVPVVVHNRSRGAVDTLVAAGARAASTPAEVAAAATRIVTMLPDGPDVAAVLEGDSGILRAMALGTIVVDSSTIAPDTARRLAARTAEAGGRFLDAPVSGGEIGAIEGTLTFMVGGDADALEAVRPLLGNEWLRAPSSLRALRVLSVIRPDAAGPARGGGRGRTGRRGGGCGWQ